MEWDFKISGAQMYATKEVLNIMEHYFWNPWFQEGAQHLAVSRCRIWRRCLAEVACIEMIDWFVTNRRDGSDVPANETRDLDRCWPIRRLEQSSRVPLCDAWLEAFNILTSRDHGTAMNLQQLIASRWISAVRLIWYFYHKPVEAHLFVLARHGHHNRTKLYHRLL